MSSCPDDYLTYRIVTKKTRSELQDAINQEMEYGWIPCGGLAINIVYRGNAVVGARYHQAMTRKGQA